MSVNETRNCLVTDILNCSNKADALQSLKSRDVDKYIVYTSKKLIKIVSNSAV